MWPTVLGDNMVAKAKKRENFIARYFKETKAELQKVVWPTREDVRNLSFIVLGVMVVMSAALGIVDYIFTRFFALIIQ
jgi:preprotein translocase subunit SecE